LSEELRSTTVFTGLTRPQMFAGVSYSFFIINVIVTAELFLIFRSWWIFAFALFFHGVGAGLSLREPRFFDLWITRMRNCPRIKNYRLWKCNSYRP
jgi:type IV secretion system protein VirB3